jgi:FixJ family two-component response regulator
MELRKTHPQVRIIAMSGGEDLAFVRVNMTAAKLLGAVKTLQKPFERKELEAALNDVLPPGA